MHKLMRSTLKCTHTTQHKPNCLHGNRTLVTPYKLNRIIELWKRLLYYLSYAHMVWFHIVYNFIITLNIIYSFIQKQSAIASFAFCIKLRKPFRISSVYVLCNMYIVERSLFAGNDNNENCQNRTQTRAHIHAKNIFSANFAMLFTAYIDANENIHRFCRLPECRIIIIIMSTYLQIAYILYTSM